MAQCKDGDEPRPILGFTFTLQKPTVDVTDTSSIFYIVYDPNNGCQWGSVVFGYKHSSKYFLMCSAEERESHEGE